MMNRFHFNPRHAFGLVSLLFLICMTSSFGVAQSAKAPPVKSAPPNVEKAEQILQSAVTALGASNYLGVRSMVGRGLYTVYKDTQPTLPLSFVDYIVYPDQERTEFKGEGFKTIQVNTGDTGWIFDGMARTLKDLKPTQVSDFKLAMRINVDNLLRGTWRKEGGKLEYAGRREAGVGKRNETVRVVYADGFAVEFEFGAVDHLPAKVIYFKNPEEGDELIREEERLAQFLNINGVMAPFVIDHYSAGVQTSRTNYRTIEFNTPIPDTLFARPANAKAVK